MARTKSGELAIAYFLTGRSPASRDRELVADDNGDLLVRSRTTRSDDPLRHYAAVVRRGPWVVVGNGEQVATIAEGLAAGKPLTAIALEHTYEPDAPIFTPRIWVAREIAQEVTHIGFAQRSARPDGGTNHVTWSVDGITEASGALMTTYSGDTATIVGATHPIDVAIEASSSDELAREIWESLQPSLRIGCVVLNPDEPSAAVQLIQRADT